MCERRLQSEHTVGSLDDVLQHGTVCVPHLVVGMEGIIRR